MEHPSRVSMTKDSKGIVTLTFRRADKLNALDMPMFVAIADAARELIPQRDVRAVILHGEGRLGAASYYARQQHENRILRHSLLDHFSLSL